MGLRLRSSGAPGGVLAGEDLVRVVQDDGAGDPVVQRLALLARDHEHERGDQGDEAQDAVDEAPGDLAQRHPPEAGHRVGLRPPAPHPEHLQGGRLPVAPDDEAPDDVADAQRDDGQRDGKEPRTDAAADAGQLRSFRQDQAGHLVEVHPLRHGGGRVLSVAVAGGHRGRGGEPGRRRRLAVALAGRRSGIALARGRRRVKSLVRRWRVICLARRRLNSILPGAVRIRKRHVDLTPLYALAASRTLCRG